MEKRYFGTDGVRDVAGSGNLTPAVILRLSQALGDTLRNSADPHGLRVGMGGDTRISYHMIRAALTAGLTSLGSEVIDFGILPTPALAYLTRARGLDMGIMISASHNPMADNGIKVFGADGFKLPEETECRVEQRMEDPDWAPLPASGRGLGRTSQDHTALEEYMIHLLGYVKGIHLGGLKVAVDCANGAAWEMAPEVLTRLGANVAVMANNPDGTNINLECGSVYPQRLSEQVVSQNCQVGVALDGDGDRAIFADARGRILNGDHILALVGMWMKEKGRLEQSRVVATVMSNLGLEMALKKDGIDLVRTPVGDRHVTARLRKDNLSLGGEQSGHIIFGRENNYTGDGVFTALKVLSVMAETKRSLEDLASVMEEYPQVLLNLKVRERRPLERMPRVQERIRNAETALGDDGRVLFRYSGTERKARVMVEGRDARQVEDLAASIADAVRQEIG